MYDTSLYSKVPYKIFYDTPLYVNMGSPINRDNKEEAGIPPRVYQ